MPWKGIGATIAAFVVSLIALGRASSIVVDWAWFSSVGYVGVFWTAFATKTDLLVTIFAVSAFLLWINGKARAAARPTIAASTSCDVRPGLRTITQDPHRCCCHGACSFSPAP